MELSTRFEQLLPQWVSGLLTPEEEAEFLELLDAATLESAGPILDQHLARARERFSGVASDERIDRIALRILAEYPSISDQAKPVRLLHRTWFRYAAVILLLVGTATYLYKTYQPVRQEIVQSTPKPATDILPGSDKAILTLADGSTIVLDSAVNGAVAEQGATKIFLPDAGKLAYSAGATSTGGTGVLYNTISTPIGGQYQVTLPDGTNVWLNAASSIRFPTAFGKERRVTVTGEVYLEVANSSQQPFFVHTASTTIAVLGTRFNVNTYSDEVAEKTTLIEGVIKIDRTVLKPGEAYSEGKVSAADIDQAIAWKKGVFNFNKVPLPTAMRQIALWYDVDVVYEKGVPNIMFWGKMSRNMKLSRVLDFMKKMGVNFRFEDRKIIIMP